MREVILLDTGTGNLGSVQKALEHVGAGVSRTSDPHRAASGRRVVLPGVGAFGDFMAGLRSRGLEPVIKEMVSRGVPVLGICVGMQALFETGEEIGIHAGLGLLPGRVAHLEAWPGIKVPHTGWNQVDVCRKSPLFDGIQPGSYVYFNHSYSCNPEIPADIVATTQHGNDFPCAVQHENLYGLQFHPEKSQAVGLRILKNFMEAT